MCLNLSLGCSELGYNYKGLLPVSIHVDTSKIALLVQQSTANSQQANKNPEMVDHLSEDQATRSVFVRNLPPGTDEQKVTIHFQRSRHGGGEIDSVRMIGEGTAVVTFDQLQSKL